MNADQSQSPRDSVSAKFDLLRVQLETAVVRPAVIAIVSSTTGDGAGITARGLADSLAGASYSTLFVDTSLQSRNQSKLSPSLALDEIGLLESTPNPKAGIVAVLSLGDLTLQKATSQRDLQSALSVFRGKFDYVVISTEYGASKSFATSLFIAADSVLVSVRKGRREAGDDGQLAAALEGIGSRFYGLVALDSSVIKDYSIAPTLPTTFEVRHRESHPCGKGTQTA